MVAPAAQAPNAAPRATLLVLGYNQEHLVDHAVAGAFAQDHPNLEIIFSDDRSDDSTFARMEAAAAAYRGPHRVITNRTAVNRGLLAHIHEGVAKSTGELIVLAAADDISYPHRVRTLVEAWVDGRPSALFSKYDVIDAAGAVIARNYRYDHSELEYPTYFSGARVVPIHGASSAYAREAFDLLPMPDRPILFEDTFFSMGLTLLGREIRFVDEALVQYREHEGSITNAGDVGTAYDDVLIRERRAERFAASVLNVLKEFADLVDRTPNPPPLDKEAMARDRHFYRLRSQWIDMPARARVRALLSTRRPTHRRWLLARLGGVRGLALAKTARARLRSGRPALRTGA